MQAVNYSHARNHLKAIIDDVCDNNEEFIITTKHDKSVIILSMDEYNRTHAALKREVHQALLEAEHGDLMDADEVFENILTNYED